MSFPQQHRTKLHSTNPLERLNGKIRRRTKAVGIFPNEAAITRLIGAILLEQDGEWAVQSARYTTLESMVSAMILLSGCPIWPLDSSDTAQDRRTDRPSNTPRHGTRPSGQPARTTRLSSLRARFPRR